MGAIKISVLYASRVPIRKWAWKGGKHWFYSPTAHDHAYRYSCWTPLTGALYLTTKWTVCSCSLTLVYKSTTLLADSLAWRPHIGRSYTQAPETNTRVRFPDPPRWGNSYIRSANPKIVRRGAPGYFKTLFISPFYVYYSFHRPISC